MRKTLIFNPDLFMISTVILSLLILPEYYQRTTTHQSLIQENREDKIPLILSEENTLAWKYSIYEVSSTGSYIYGDTTYIVYLEKTKLAESSEADLPKHLLPTGVVISPVWNIIDWHGSLAQIFETTTGLDITEDYLPEASTILLPRYAKQDSTWRYGVDARMRVIGTDSIRVFQQIYPAIIIEDLVMFSFKTVYYWVIDLALVRIEETLLDGSKRIYQLERIIKR